MRMNPFSIATKGKGISGAIKRAMTIRKRYGMTSSQMERQLDRFVSILKEFDCGATFPITAIALARTKGFAHKYRDQNIEFAIHGYAHLDHTQLSLEQLTRHFDKSLAILKDQGLSCSGFRSPYLRWSEDTIRAIRRTGFQYDSSQGLSWDVVDKVKTEAYERVLDFYRAIPANDYPALPFLEDDLVRLPYCLPDDESLVERFQLHTAEAMTPIWEAILTESYRLGELFTLGLHPERIAHCETSLISVLKRARELSPPVWFARLDEIARWWKARTESRLTIQQMNNLEFEMHVDGPKGVTILSRNVEVLTPTSTWDGVIQRSPETLLRFRADRRPFIGVSPASTPQLTGFLRQQGYIVETAEDDQSHTHYLDRPIFRHQDHRQILEKIEQTNFPLIRLGRWPNGARSALCVTGDIDALTIWDYGLRFLDK